MDLIPLLVLTLASFAVAAVLGAIRGYRLDNLLLSSLGLSLVLAALAWPAVDGRGDEAVKVAIGGFAGGLFTFALERERVRKLHASLKPTQQS